jgi:hypothetical protein
VRGLNAILLGLLAVFAARAADPEPVIRAVQAEEQAAGYKPTGNFARPDARVTAYYRCYYTGKLQLPGSYDELHLREGRKDGCRIDEKKYDVFFYPIEAVASGHAPVTQALAAATPQRLAAVVPHEDFHAQVGELPDRIAEAASTLAGFLTGAAALADLGQPPAASEAELFLRKAVIINRYFDELGAVYQSARARKISKAAALTAKTRLLVQLQQECGSILPAPRSFDRCVSAANNAGLSFDHTYTEYYPLLYSVFESCRKDLHCTVETVVKAPRKRPEAETAAYFQRFVRDHSPR